MLSRTLLTKGFVVALVAIASTASGKDVTPPQNSPANAQWDAATGRLTLEYHGDKIFSGAVTATDADGKTVPLKFDAKADTVDEMVEQTLTFTPAKAKEGVTLSLKGTITASEEATATCNSTTPTSRAMAVAPRIG